MKHHANKGVERNKKPLKNKVYEIEIITESQLKANADLNRLAQYKFKEGYLMLFWYNQGEKNKNWYGFITSEFLKNKLGEKQYSKFCQGKRIFIEQKRVNKKNVKK